MLRNSCLLLVFFVTILDVSDSSAQTGPDPYLKFEQVSVPAPDSGGRYAPFTMNVTNLSQDTITFGMAAFSNPQSRSQSVWAIDPSATLLADTFWVVRNNVNYYTLDTTYVFTVPPHKSDPDLQLPFVFLATKNDTKVDTTSMLIHYNYVVSHVTYGFDATAKGIPACPGPTFPYDTHPVTNASAPWSPGDPPQYMGGAVSGGLVSNFDGYIPATTTTSYKIVGESSDRFVAPRDSTYRHDTYFTSFPAPIYFLGANKPRLYDTLIGTYTDCWGTTVIRTPIVAYSAYKQAVQLLSSSGTINANLLGHAQGIVATITNPLSIPIAIKDLRFSGYDSTNFTVEGPGIIPAQGTGRIIVQFWDNNLRKDLSSPDYGSTLLGSIVPDQDDLPLQDSTFSIDVSGKVVAYCPNYFTFVPPIKHNVTPYGIIFGSQQKQLTLVFANDDSVNEYFYPPYIDDSHISIAVTNVSLPAMIEPSILFSQGIQTNITFTGDDQHNYITKLHWPRGNDTVTMPVVVVGMQAPPIDLGVTTDASNGSIGVWPNPASSIVHTNAGQCSILIFDALGRLVAKENLSSASPEFDVSNLVSGLYRIVVPSRGTSVSLQVVR